MKEKILITASTFPRYKGDTIPSFIYQYAKELSEYFDIIVLCPFSKETVPFEIMDGIKVYRYKYLPFNLNSLAYRGGIGPRLRQNPLTVFQIPFFLFFQLVNIIKLVKKYNIKKIHAHWIIPQGIVAVFYKLVFNKKIKILTTGHGGDIYSLNNHLVRYLKKIVIKNADKVTCVSNALKKEVLKLYKRDDIEVIPMGINTGQFSPEKYSPDIINKWQIKGNFLLFVGRLVEKKGLYYLINAMPEVIKKYPETKLIIAGDGPEQNSLINLCKKINVDKNVIFIGPVEHKHLPKYFATADIFIGPSIQAAGGDSEGFGLVFAESLSCGTPVITTNLPAIRDIIKNNFNGCVVEQKNSKMLAEKIIQLLEKPDKIKEMNKNGRKYIIENFDWKIISEKYKQLINNLD